MKHFRHKKYLSLVQAGLAFISFLWSATLNAESVRQIQKVVPSNRSTRSYFGYRVSVSGNFAAIGAHGENESTGAVYIFQKDETTGTWLQKQRLTASDATFGQLFGLSVSMSGNTLVVGAPAGANAVQDRVGALYVFERDTITNIWKQLFDDY